MGSRTVESGGGKVVNLAGRGRARRLDPEVQRVVDLVCREFAVTVGDLIQPSRGRAEIAHARQLAIYLCYVALGRRLATIGLVFGRDRSTASYACARIEDMRDDPAFDERVTALEAAIGAVDRDQDCPEAIRAAG